MSNPRIILNSIRTPDGTVLTSTFRHDYQQHKDTNGEFYMVDGGLDYMRRAFNQSEPYEELSVNEASDWDVIRRTVTWGTYGKDGKSRFVRKVMEDMSNDHLQAIIGDGYKGVFVDMMKKEIIYRKDKGIIIED